MTCGHDSPLPRRLAGAKKIQHCTALHCSQAVSTTELQSVALQQGLLAYGLVACQKFGSRRCEVATALAVAEYQNEWRLKTDLVYSADLSCWFMTRPHPRVVLTPEHSEKQRCCTDHDGI